MHEFEKKDIKKIIIYTLLIYVLIRMGIYCSDLISKDKHKEETPVVQDVNKELQGQKTDLDKGLVPLPKTDETINFTVNPPMFFNGKSREEIYNLRKEYAKNSPFFPEDYEPSSDVFGQIVDGKPWYGIDSRPCAVDEPVDNTKGITLLSPVVNNPNALVGIFMPVVYNKKGRGARGDEFCQAHEKFLYSPKSIVYKGAENTLEVTYKLDSMLAGNTVEFNVVGLNARDAGFEYITSPDFVNGYFYDRTWVGGQLVDNPNVAHEVFKMNDFIHLGSSCRYQDGCNNISPLQSYLHFGIEKYPAEISLKLWRKRPNNRSAKADLNCKIIFE